MKTSLILYLLLVAGIPVQSSSAERVLVVAPSILPEVR